MISGRTLRAAVLAAAVASAVACVTYRGPRGVEAALEDQLGRDLDREFGLKLGWTTTKLAGTILAHDGDEDTLIFKDLTGLGVAVFKVPEDAGGPSWLDPQRLHIGRFETVLNVRDKDGQVLLLTKSRGDSIREALFVACDEDEVVVARLRGDLNRLLDRVVRETDENGVRGARRAVPIASR